MIYTATAAVPSKHLVVALLLCGLPPPTSQLGITWATLYARNTKHCCVTTKGSTGNPCCRCNTYGTQLYTAIIFVMQFTATAVFSCGPEMRRVNWVRGSKSAVQQHEAAVVLQQCTADYDRFCFSTSPHFQKYMTEKRGKKLSCCNVAGCRPLKKKVNQKEHDYKGFGG